jgi:N-methylhydantoinase B/oxoprolinase/acetone carboxylase alpha subunit
VSNFLSSTQSPTHRVPLVVSEYTLPVVQSYMYHIRSNAENSVRNLLRDVVTRMGTTTLEAKDWLDDGSVVRIQPYQSPHLLTKVLSRSNLK